MLIIPPDSLAFWFILLFVSLSLLTLLFIGAWRLWFSNRRWKFRTSDDKKKWYPYFNHANKSPEYWKGEKQEIGMFYEIDLGREYKILGVHFDCGYTSDAPIESKIWFTDRNGGWPLLQKSEHPYIKLNIEEDPTLLSTTMIALNEPLKAQKIMMTIAKPDVLNGMTKPWRIEAVYVKVMALHGLIKQTIGRSLFDRL